MFPTHRWTVSVMTLLVSLNAFSQDRPFSVRDDIGMVRFNDFAAQATSSGTDTANRSPDGQYFAFVTTKGLLDEDLVESDINVLSRKQLKAYLLEPSTHHQPQPTVVGRFKSYPHHEEPSAYAPVIKNVRWSPNGRQLFFRVENLEGNYQLYAADLDGSSAQVLTPPTRSVEQFDVVKDIIAYTYSTPQSGDLLDVPKNPDAIDITGRSLFEVLFPGRMTVLRPETYSMGFLKRVQGHWHGHSAPQYSVRDVS